MGSVSIGVDVGQRVDPTAIAVAEEDRRRALLVGREQTHWTIRHLERLPLGTNYPAVAHRVADVVAGVHERTGQLPTIWVDATGVGVPLLDVLRAGQVKGTLVGCFFTHGDRRTEERIGGRLEVKIGKAYLVSRLQALLQQGLLHLPKTAEADALARELLDYEIRVDENANDRYGAFKVGTHDDLVTALGLACQRQSQLPFQHVKLPGEGEADPDEARRQRYLAACLADESRWRTLER